MNTERPTVFLGSWKPVRGRPVMPAVLLPMFRILSLLIVVIVCGCSNRIESRARFNDGFAGEIVLTQEFSDSLRRLVSHEGKPVLLPDPDELPLAVAPEGTIELDGKTYDFYPDFVRRGDFTWRNDATTQFFRAMYPLDGTPSVDPAEFSPSE